MRELVTYRHSRVTAIATAEVTAVATITTAAYGGFLVPYPQTGCFGIATLKFRDL